MKLFLAASLILVAFLIAAAQSGPVAPQEGSRVAAPPGWCSGCTDAQKEQIISRETRAKEVADSNESPGAPKVARGNNPRPHAYALYPTRFLITNHSDKKTKQVKWEATLINRDTKETIQTFSLVTRKSIGRHKNAVIKENLVVPLRQLTGPVVTAGQPGMPDIVGKYKIVEIEYKDGSVFRP